jgi:hypothetical protein
MSMRECRLPLSAAQRDFWDAANSARTPCTHVRLAEYIEIAGAVDPALLEYSVRALIREARSLHTVRLVAEADRIVRVLDSTVADRWTMPYFDVSGCRDSHERAWQSMLERFSVGYNPARGPFFDFALYKVGTRRFYWYHGYAHIIIDGYSCNLIARRVAELYSSLEESRVASSCEFASLEALAEDEAAYKRSPLYGADKHYWLKRFDDGPRATTLAGRALRMERDELFDLRETRWLSTDDTARFIYLTREHLRSTMPRVLAALTAFYMHLQTQSEDIVISITAKARSSVRELRTPSQNANMLPLRLAVLPTMTLESLVREADRAMDELRQHQRYRMGDLHRELVSLQNSQGVFGTEINVMSFDYNLRFGLHKATSHNISVGTTDDFMINLTDRCAGGALRLDFDASPQYYTRGQLREHADGFLRVMLELLELVRRPNIFVEEVSRTAYDQ